MLSDQEQHLYPFLWCRCCLPLVRQTGIGFIGSKGTKHAACVNASACFLWAARSGDANLVSTRETVLSYVINLLMKLEALFTVGELWL